MPLLDSLRANHVGRRRGTVAHGGPVPGGGHRPEELGEEAHDERLERRQAGADYGEVHFDGPPVGDGAELVGGVVEIQAADGDQSDK